MLFLLMSQGASAQEYSRTFRVLTYNIRYGERADIERLSRVIMATDPDFVGLQEVEIQVKHTKKMAANNVQMVSQFTQHTGLYSFFGGPFEIPRYPFGFGGGEFGNAVFSRYSFDEARRHIYDACGSEPRSAVEVIVTLHGGERVRFVTTHLDHKDNPVRLAQVAQLDKLFSDDLIPTVICGDFNERPDHPNGSIRQMEQNWDRCCNDDPTFIAWNPKVKLDYVFCRPAGRWKVTGCVVVDEPDASDHRPLLVTLELLD